MLSRLGTLGLVLVLLLSPMAVWAHYVVNDVEADSEHDTFTLGGSTTVRYKVVATGGDGKDQRACRCNSHTGVTDVHHLW